MQRAGVVIGGRRRTKLCGEIALQPQRQWLEVNFWTAKKHSALSGNDDETRQTGDHSDGVRVRANSI